MANKPGGLKLSGLVDAANINQPVTKQFGIAQQNPSPDTHAGLGKKGMDHGIETSILVHLGLIRRSPYQNRSRVPQDEINLLAEDIRRDGLRSPVILRQVDGEQYELVSGETRVEAFRALGRDEIPAFIRRMGDADAARGTVLDNFLHRNLADYEIYKGLKTLMDCGAASSLAQLSGMTQWGKSHIHRFMSFGRFPQDALDILEETPGLASAKTAGDFAKLLGDGMPHGLIADTLRLVASGRLDPGKAANWAERKWQDSLREPVAGYPSKHAVVLPSGKLAFTISKTAKGLVVVGEKGVPVDWDALETDLAAWLSERVSKP